MNPEAVQKLEEMCEAMLPPEYISLLDSYPEALRTAQRADHGIADDGRVCDVELLSSADQIVELNREVRLGTILDPAGQEFRWPDQLLVIGETGDGDYYCIDTDGEHQGVLQFRHYAVEFEIVADSLSEFVEMLEEAFQSHSESTDDDPDTNENENRRPRVIPHAVTEEY